MQSKGLARVPNTEIITYPYDFPHVLFSDDDNVTFRRIADKVYKECYRRFSQSRCRYSITETEVKVISDKRNDKSLRVRVMGPRGPNTLVHSEPAFLLSEYLLYVCSCFGIWLGISVLRLNPITLMSVVKLSMRWKRGDKVEEGKADADIRKSMADPAAGHANNVACHNRSSAS